MLFVHQGNSTKNTDSAYRIYTFLLSNKTNQPTHFLVVTTRKWLQVVQILYFIVWHEHDRCDSLQIST